MGTHPIFESDFDCLTEIERGCKFSLKPLRVKRLPSRSRLPILSRMLRPKSRIKREFPRISSVSFLPVNSWRMAELFLITISRKNQPFTLCSVFEEVVKNVRRSSTPRLRRECPVAGPGHFMANHKDRYFSGKTGHTI